MLREITAVTEKGIQCLTENVREGSVDYTNKFYPHARAFLLSHMTTAARKDGMTITEQYREYLELGIVNTNVRLGDLRNLMKDVRFGEGNFATDSILHFALPP